MRTALILGVCLLAFALALRLSEQLPAGGLDRHPNDAGTPVIAAARGELLPYPRYGPTGDELSRVIHLGDATYQTGRAGLLLAQSLPGAGPRRHVTLDPGALEADLARLGCWLGDARTGTQLVIISSGRVSPSDPDPARNLVRLEELARLLSLLGAETNPFEHQRASWAYVGVRLRDGWARLAEGFSLDSGVLLSFTISPDWRDYRGFAGELLIVEAEDRVARVRLARQLSDATVSPTVLFVGSAQIGGLGLPSIYARPGGNGPDRRPAPSSIVWERVPLRAGTRFSTRIGLGPGAREVSDGVIFQLWIDGRLLYQESLGVEQPPPGEWRTWDLDLGAFAGRTVRFELRVDPLGGSAGDRALWGDPVLEG